MNIGFTGTQNGMTNKQKQSVRRLLATEVDFTLHHGDCIGADAEADEIAKEIGEDNTVIHPPEISAKRAFCSSTNIKDPKPYLERNHDIVDDSEYLIATPGTTEEVLRSGTWATIRYARKQQKHVAIVYPDGTTG